VQNLIRALEDGHLRAEPLECLGEFAADGSRANYAQAARRSVRVKTLSLSK